MWLSVKSGVPQGTVLGPFLFLLYINDIAKDLSSNLRLFADDCVLYCVISCDHEIAELQRDLNTLFKWSQLWQMKYNISKCVTRAGLRDCGALRKVIWGGPPEEVVANHILP